MKQLYTRWGKQIDGNHILQEYPRPLLKRDSYVNLNGYWDYAITKKFQRPKNYDGKILVPFSPESVLSGVNRQLQPDEYLWYRTNINIDNDKLNTGGRLILHFGAVDQACRVYVNRQAAGRHIGGYLPFSLDITEYLQFEEENEIVLAVRDLSDTSYHTKGKQKLKRGGMFYTAQSGIWQTVWMEYVPEYFIEELVTEPDLQQENVRILVRANAKLPIKIQVKEPGLYQEILEEKRDLTRKAKEADDQFIAETSGISNEYIEIPLPVAKPWTCEEPYLYYFTVSMGEDTAESYFALRTFTIEPDNDGIPRICLNGCTQFQKGVLDQGYWPDGLYTAPSDEAFIFDILEMKKTGFNMIRKHIKIEPQRWYYHCDRLGMIVWQDMVNGGTYYKHWFVTYAATLLSRMKWKITDRCPYLLSRTDEKGKREFIREMKETIRQLKGHPSIAAWVIFNEGWGQFHANEVSEIARKCDNTRLIDQASGWFDQNGGDMQSVHNYFFKLEIEPEQKRATVLSEYGGYSMQVPEHSACEKLYGYGTHKSEDSLNAAYRKRMQEVEALIPKGLCASVYTQLSDVEEEVNGIFTYDREVRKMLAEIPEKMLSPDNPKK